MRGRRAEFYRERLGCQPAWLVAVLAGFWGTSFAVAAGVGGVGWIRWAALGGGVVALLALRALRRSLAALRRGVAVGEMGLVERFWFRRAVRHGWDSIREVRIGDGEAFVVTDRGGVRLDGQIMPGWRQLARRVEQGLSGPSREAAGGGPFVPPEQIAEWLGIPVDGELRTASRRGTVKIGCLTTVWVGVTIMLVGLYFPLFRAVATVEQVSRLGLFLFAGAHATIFFGVFSGGLLWKLIQALQNVSGGAFRADVTGLWRGGTMGWQHLGWDELDTMVMVGGGWQVSCREQTFTIPPQAARLITTIQHLLRARQDGLRLPSTSPIPAGALTLATDPSTSADRGLSLTGPAANDHLAARLTDPQSPAVSGSADRPDSAETLDAGGPDAD